NQTSLDGEQVNLPITATDSTNHTLTYSALNLPTGLSINPTTGVITGTIASTAHTGSPYNSSVTATNGTNSATTAFTWTVNPVVTVSAVSNQTNAEGDDVSVQIDATDANGDPLTYSASNLPGGLSIDTSSGLISGTVAAGAQALSPYSVTVTATDGTFN